MNAKKSINSFLDIISEYIEKKFETVILRRIIMAANKEIITSFIFIPVQFKGFILKTDLTRSTYTYINIIDDIKAGLGHSLGDAGIIKMSYICEGFENEIMSVSDDNLLTPDIYEKLGTVSYAKIQIEFRYP